MDADTALSFACLGSGSAGNCTLIRAGRAGRYRHLLIDAGLAVRPTRDRLAEFGVELESITDILVTHLDADHFRSSWCRTIDETGITVHVHRRHQRRAIASGAPVERLRCFDEPFELDGGTRVEHALLAHDVLGSIGFVIEHDGLRLGHATDLGTISDELLEQFTDLHGLAIESNYDRALQLSSGRPDMLKRRIMTGLGHLSNEQSARAVRRIDGQSQLSQLVLLHLSRQCNSPHIVKSLYARRLPHLLDRLTITSQTRATRMLHVTDDHPRAAPACVRGEQMVLF